MERIQEALLERDQAQAREVQSRREIARLQQQLQGTGAERVRAVSTAVKQAQAKVGGEVAARESELKTALRRCTELQAWAGGLRTRSASPRVLVLACSSVHRRSAVPRGRLSLCLSYLPAGGRARRLA